MLVKMPRGLADESRVSVREEGEPFEAALRRDLASAPVISYESTIGGWIKRAFDVVLTLATSPIWIPLLAAASLAARLRHHEPVFQADERVGYGGRPFHCFQLRLDRSSADVLILRPAGGE